MRRLIVVLCLVAALAASIYAAQGRTRIEGVMSGFAPASPEAQDAWVQSKVREALRLAQPVSHYQTESAAESLAHWSNSPRGSIWLHHRPYDTDTAGYYGFVKFHDDSIRVLAMIDPRTGKLVSGELDPRWDSWLDTFVYIVGGSDSSMERTGSYAKKLRVDTGHPFNWSAFHSFSKSIRVRNGSGYYYGADTTSNGGWRSFVVGDSVLWQRRVSGAWATKLSALPLGFGFYNATGKRNYFQTSTSQTADYAYVWPVDDGTANQRLVTNGSGTLSWSSSLYLGHQSITTPSAPTDAELNTAFGSGLADGNFGTVTTTEGAEAWYICVRANGAWRIVALIDAL